MILPPLVFPVYSTQTHSVPGLVKVEKIQIIFHFKSAANAASIEGEILIEAVSIHHNLLTEVNV